MNSKDNKSKNMFGLGRLQDLFNKVVESDRPITYDESSDNTNSDDESNIPVLNETIPELNEKIEVVDNYSVSLNPEHSTETVEQQMVRTHHEEKPHAPELVDSSQYTQTVTLPESYLDEQQLDLEESAVKEKIEHLEIPEPEETTEEAIKILETELTDIAIEDMRELLLEKTWGKIEMLMMSHLPPQISGPYLFILNATIEDNKQKIREELSLLDKHSIEELLKSLTTEDDKRN